MATGATSYGDITPRQAAFSAKRFLERAVPILVIEKFGQSHPLPGNNTKTMKFRRYKSLDATPNALTEGVTPTAKKLESEDVECTLVQYGDRIQISDVILDTHEDPVLMEAEEVLGEQAAEMIETMRFGIIKAGTSVTYANGSSRTAVNTPITLTLQRKITRALKRQNAKRITRVIKSTASFGTASVNAGFVAMCHPDCESDIRGMTGYTSVENYGQMTPWESEIGKVEDVRYVTSTVFQPWADAGGAKAGSGSTMLSTTGTSADVYPIIYVGRDAYGIVALKGKFAVKIMAVNPKPSDSDPLGQRAHVGWKSMQTAVILNDMWMNRAEVAVSEL